MADAALGTRLSRTGERSTTVVTTPSGPGSKESMTASQDAAAPVTRSTAWETLHGLMSPAPTPSAKVSRLRAR